MPTSFRVGGRQHGSHANREWTVGPAYSKNPRTLRNNMHENREISSTPWSDEQGRSAKATSRTADMYVPEKSDCAVLPVNQPNKGGQLSAEAGEGRAGENVIPRNWRDTSTRAFVPVTRRSPAVWKERGARSCYSWWGRAWNSTTRIRKRYSYAISESTNIYTGWKPKSIRPATRYRNPRVEGKAHARASRTLICVGIYTVSPA